LQQRQCPIRFPFSRRRGAAILLVVPGRSKHSLELKMKCNLKVMLSVAAAMAAAAGFAYLTFEEARAAILASLPILAVLLCPISMLVMMKMMHSGGGADQCSTDPAKPRSPAPESANPAKEAS
jgi:hypothetical protein